MATGDQGGFIMGVKLAFLATLEARQGKGAELGKFLEAGRDLAATEAGTVTWYAFRVDETHYGIFDTFETEDARAAHLTGPIPRRSARSPATCWRAVDQARRRHRRQVNRVQRNAG
jgi:quinol monooxygenase YgiN